MTHTLEPYSRQMVEELFIEFPEWKPFLSVIPENGLNFFRIEVPSWPKTNNSPLGITSQYNGEITVYFDTCHHHYTAMQPSKADPTGALAFIRQILHEEVAVVSYIYIGVELIADGAHHGAFVPIDQIPTANHEYPYAIALRVRSWKGTYNNEFPAPYLSNKSN